MRYDWLAFVDYIFLDYLQPVTLPLFKLLLTCKHGFLPVLKLHELLSMLLSSTSCKGVSVLHHWRMLSSSMCYLQM